ncbi:hypothetical protein C8Q75DRAFT_136807 [Abortiporus biennis]|nr:hypothetical protein C8Q75DRAFT_136807 [Abortiporus biennis]
MFREIPQEPKFKSSLDSSIHCDTRLQRLTEPAKFREYLHDAALFKTKYDFEVAGILRKYGICEAECVVGLFLRSPDTRLRVEKDHDLRTALREAYREVVIHAKSAMDEFIGGDVMPEENRLAWALACYKITYDPEYSRYPDIGLSKASLPVGHTERGEPEYDSERTDSDSMECEELVEDVPLERRWSFPWLFCKELCALV